jgi:hypothetical protein
MPTTLNELPIRGEKTLSHQNGCVLLWTATSLVRSYRPCRWCNFTAAVCFEPQVLAFDRPHEITDRVDDRRRVCHLEARDHPRGDYYFEAIKPVGSEIVAEARLGIDAWMGGLARARAQTGFRPPARCSPLEGRTTQRERQRKRC